MYPQRQSVNSDRLAAHKGHVANTRLKREPTIKLCQTKNIGMNITLGGQRRPLHIQRDGS